MTEQNPKPVVVAVGNDPIDSALEFAVAEALREGCGVHLVHALHVLSSGPEMALLDFSDAERIARSTLSGAAERALDLVPDGVTLTTELVRGPVVPSVVKAAADARMIVLERRDLSRRMRVVTRSVSSGVAAHAHVPVVSVPTGRSESAAPSTGSVVTVGVDIPERCRAILSAGVAAARTRNATLHVLHTWWFPSVYDDIIMSRVEDDSWANRARSAIEVVLGELADEVTDMAVRIDARHGHPADALIAASRDSALLVVGRHDPLVPVGSHLGPVARAVLREAHCPVLLANPRASHHWGEHATEASAAGQPAGKSAAQPV
jgi:nucleotide-binding universal stress UspA family protein